jgi:L-ascorbate metabolism protein UlaG (beta-lactamase superfamily)
MVNAPVLTYVGGPTLLIEWHGVRLLTDPTLDPAGTTYPTAEYTLVKTGGPGVPPSELGDIDAVLLSHDHHFDNLDRAGRAFLPQADAVLTTRDGAARLGGRAHGLAAGASQVIQARSGTSVRVTATPARHGPEGGDRGPVIGFLLEAERDPTSALWVTGDTVGYEGLEAIAPRAPLRGIVAFMGAAMVRVAGPHALTLTANEGVRLAERFPSATIVPVHYEDWEHFTEGRAEIESTFRSVGLDGRLQWLERGRPTPLATIDE